MFHPDLWVWSIENRQVCRIIERQDLWGETICRVWLPGSDSVVRIPASRLKSLDSAGAHSSDHIAYIAAAARVADALIQDILLAPIEASIIPLPHQIRALSRAIASDPDSPDGLRHTDRVRFMLADEVGLGKTIEAGLILRELKLRGLVKRTLVVVPRGLVPQWISEMRTHFNEHFHHILPDDLETLKRISTVIQIQDSGSDNAQSSRSSFLGAPQSNAWRLFSQVIVSMDSVKPLEKRRGWIADQVAEYNRERFEDLISAGWDLVIVDEAHRLGGSTDQIARFRLGQGLSDAAPCILLLSATPHQGKSDAFYRLVSLLDSRAFPNLESVTRERIQPYIIRTEKRHAIDADGKTLFKPRRTELAPVFWKESHQGQKRLYEAVTGYVREGYNRALVEKRNYIGFLMILMQRLVVSSTRAILTTLEKRAEVLNAEESGVRQRQVFSDESLPYSPDDYHDMDGQEQMEILLLSSLRALEYEQKEVRLLLESAKRCEQTGPDAKAEALLDWIYRLQAEEGDPAFKLIVFTEFIPTQEMLRDFLSERGFHVVCLNGNMDMEERKRVQETFAKEARILVSTDAGGEGLNLQFCHVVINYDIPWNPMRLEQRIGRVDRIGQTHIVRAVNFLFQDSVEGRVREVLEEKLSVIFKEYGIDKTGDVLDSAQACRMFDDLYVEAILHPDQIETSVERAVANFQEQTREARESVSILGNSAEMDPGEAQRLMFHPLPYWVERMTVSYLKAHGGKAEKSGELWDLTWPDGERVFPAVFAIREAGENPAARHLTLEDPKIRDLAMKLPYFVPGQMIPVVFIPGISTEIQGFWSLWRIAIASMELNHWRNMPLFLADNGKLYSPTARHVWDQLLGTSPQVLSFLDPDKSQDACNHLQQAAEEQGKTIYETLLHEHKARISREREKAGYSFTARRKTIEQIGLPQVRNFRLNALAEEERIFQEQIERRSQVYPEMVPLLVIRLEGNVHE